jgi:prepilin-type N-terminal cleavage/methylation domain-containing protein
MKTARRNASFRKIRARGFTLVELLVVVVVIGILVGLAVPALQKALRSAANAQDMSNLRQIGLALSNFEAENNGRIPNNSIPVPGTDSGGSGDRPSFMESVDRMMAPDSNFSSGSVYNWQRRSIWFSKRFAQIPSGKSYNKSTQYYWGTAWGMNPFLWATDGIPNARPFQGYIVKAPNRSRLVIVGEKNRNAGHDFNPRVAAETRSNVETNYRVSRDGKAYYLFADYHIESIAGDQSTVAFPEYGSYDPNNPPRLYYRW